MDKTDKRIKLFKQRFLSEGYNLYIDKNMSNACAFSLVFAWIWYKWNGFFVLKITSSSFYTANEWPLNRPNKYHGKKSIATRHCWVVKRQHSIFFNILINQTQFMTPIYQCMNYKDAIMCEACAMCLPL